MVCLICTPEARGLRVPGVHIRQTMSAHGSDGQYIDSESIFENLLGIKNIEILCKFQYLI